MTPPPSATTLKSPVARSSGEALPGRDLRRHDPGVEGHPLHVVELRGGQWRPVDAEGVADHVELGAQRDPGPEGVRGRHPAAGRDLREDAVDLTGAVRCPPEVPVPDLGEGLLRHEREGADQGDGQAQPAPGGGQQPSALDHRRDGDGHEDGVVLVPGVPVGVAIGDEPPAVGGQRDEQQHRRAQRQQTGRDEQEQHGAHLVVGTVGEEPQCLCGTGRAVLLGEAAGVLGRRQQPQRDQQERDRADDHRDDTPAA